MWFKSKERTSSLLIVLVVAALIVMIKLKSHERRFLDRLETVAPPEDSTDVSALHHGGYSNVIVSFKIEDEFAPPLPEHAEPIGTLKRFYFTADNYDPQTRTYSKTFQSDAVKIAELEADLAANRYQNYRLHIVDPDKADYAFFGRLTVECGDGSSAKQVVDEKHRAWGVAAAPETDG